MWNLLPAFSRECLSSLSSLTLKGLTCTSLIPNGSGPCGPAKLDTALPASVVAAVVYDPTVNGVAGVMGMFKLDGVFGESGHLRRGPLLKVESAADAVEAVETEDMDETLKAGDTIPLRWKSSAPGTWRSWVVLPKPCESGEALDQTKFLMLARLKAGRAGVLAAEGGTDEVAEGVEAEEAADTGGEASDDVGIW